MKEKKLSQDEIREILDKIEFEKAVKRLRVVGNITAGAMAAKGIQLIAPKAIATFSGSAINFAGLAIPNYLLVVIGIGVFTTGLTKFTAARAEMEKTKDKTNIPMEKLFKLED